MQNWGKLGRMSQKGQNNSNYRHGESKTRLYAIWFMIKQRCLNKNNKDFQYYGGRGITICPEWLEFIPFRNWALNNGYKENLEIDRINTNDNYEPSNCRFLTHKENIRNRRNTINMQIANEIRGLYATGDYIQQELAEKYNMNQQNISKIVNNKVWWIND